MVNRARLEQATNYQADDLCQETDRKDVLNASNFAHFEKAGEHGQYDTENRQNRNDASLTLVLSDGEPSRDQDGCQKTKDYQAGQTLS